MKKVIILRGISGSGKSTLAKKLKEENGPAVICSADNYFMKGDKYEFNPKELTAAHGACFKQYLELLRDPKFGHGEVQLLIVDNTNILAWEIAPYMLSASAYGWDAEILTIMCPEEIAAARNVHGLDKRKVNDQMNKLIRSWIPKNWSNTVVEWTQ
jgi:predicted kinase